jgi:ankyrin repeat protein
MKTVSKLSRSPEPPLIINDVLKKSCVADAPSTSTPKSGRLLSFRKFGNISKHLQQRQEDWFRSGEPLLFVDNSIRTSTSSVRSSETAVQPLQDNNTDRKSMHTQQRHNMKLIQLCRKYPRIQDVMTVLEKHPDSLQATNNMGQTPLHVAAAHGVNAEVVMYLLGKDPQAASVVDNQGKLPLHYAAKQSHWRAEDGVCFLNISDVEAVMNGESDDDHVLDPMYKNMVKAVAKAYPKALSHEDDNGCNPIEYALMNDASLDVVKTLQRTAVNSLRQRAAPVMFTKPLKEHDRCAVAGKSA